MAIIKKPVGGGKSTTVNDQKRISDAVKKRLDFHINAEMEASQIYRAMGTWCEYNGMFKAAKYFQNHAEEELGHMKRVQKYLLDRSCLPATPEVKKVSVDFEDLVDVVRKAYEHEVKVSMMYEESAQLAITTPCHTTYVFLQWFLKEQIEEESSFKNLLDKVDMMKKEGVGMLEIEDAISGTSLI